MRELDLHGMKTADAISFFTREYENALESGTSCFKVIHGYGSGGIGGDTRRSIRSLLAANPACADFVAGEDVDGNPGYTVVYPKRRLPSGSVGLYDSIVEFCSSPNNILLSLGLGVALMSTLEWTKDTGRYWTGIPIALAIGAVSLATEASLYGLAMILIFYFFRGDSMAMAAIYILASVVISWPAGALTEARILLFDYQWMMIFATPFFFLYNGKRGSGSELVKWFFYIFYPAHIWIIYIIYVCSS